MRFGSVGLRNGPRLHFADQGEPGGQPVLFLHGWPDSWFTFSRVLPDLPPGVRSIAVDQCGFGESDRPDCCYGIDDLAGDAVALLDALSIERATIVGHSLGTFIARRVAIAHPGRVERLVLISSGFTSASPALLEAQGVIADLEDPLPVEFVREFQSGTAYVPLPDSFFEGVVAESMKAPVRVWREVIAGLFAYDDTRDLSRINSPALLLWGENDAVFESREDQERLAAAIPAATLRVYPETGHCPNWERPEQVAADIAAFLHAS